MTWILGPGIPDSGLRVVHQMKSLFMENSVQWALYRECVFCKAKVTMKLAIRMPQGSG